MRTHDAEQVGWVGRGPDRRADALGPYASCGVLDRAGLTVSQYVALDCWMTNAHGNIWWAVNTYNGHRWVYNENFYGTPPARSAATRC